MGELFLSQLCYTQTIIRKAVIPMKRTKLSERTLPNYTQAEELMNMVTHILGGVLGILVFILCPIRAHGNTPALIASVIYGLSMTALYAFSSIYHGLRPGMAKKVLQVIDHCSIYFLISGTYTPILLSAFLPRYPGIAWGLLGVQWGLCGIAATLTAIDLRKYRVVSMICYIAMGWSIIFFLPQTLAVMTRPGFFWLLAGGIAYTVGAILYGIGSKTRWFHSVFHIFVVIGSLLQFIAIYLYAM